MPRAIVDRPTPLDRADVYRWEITSLRHRLLTGAWRPDAEAALAEQFSAEVSGTMPAAEVSRNPFLSMVTQTATLYDSPPLVTTTGVATGQEGPDLAPITGDGALWVKQQDTVLFVQGLRECAVRLDWVEGTGLTHTVVTPDHIANVKTAPGDPSTLVALDYLRERTIEGRTVWAWDRWDISDLDAPVFAVLLPERIDGADVLVDVTTLALPDAEPGAYPYRDRAGVPILPWVMYHAHLGRTWGHMRGIEAVYGTLTASTLWTMWMGGFRDGSHPQRATIDCEAVAASTTRATTGGVRHIKMQRTGILELRSIGDKSGSIQQWQAVMEPKMAGEAIEAFEAGLAIYVGLSPADVQRGSARMSGYAIVISRDGLRRAQIRLIPPMRRSDQLTLATGARLANAFAGLDLPEVPSEYRIEYAKIKRSPEEIRAEMDEIFSLVDRKLIHPVVAYQRLNPGVTTSQATDDLASIAAAWDVLGGVTPEATDTDTDTDADTEEPPT